MKVPSTNANAYLASKGSFARTQTQLQLLPGQHSSTQKMYDPSDMQKDQLQGELLVYVYVTLIKHLHSQCYRYQSPSTLDPAVGTMLMEWGAVLSLAM